MELWQEGQRNGWMVIATSAGEAVKDEPIAPVVVCMLIAQTPQVQLVRLFAKRMRKLYSKLVRIGGRVGVVFAECRWGREGVVFLLTAAMTMGNNNSLILI